jgi:poly-gamma-glutamate capsule biosynthesis protein CapA/YwtB (metallophosphatase superfamily)
VSCSSSETARGASHAGPHVSLGNLKSALVASLVPLFLISCYGPVQKLGGGPGSPSLPAANTLVFAGDVMLTRGVGRRIRESRDPALPFRKIAPYFSAADLSFVNLESPFSETGKRTESGIIFNADPANVAGLVLAGVDIASTANNHSRDCGPKGVEFTYSWLKSHGIQPVGTALSAACTHQGIVIERHGVRFGFVAYTYDQSNGNWHKDDDRVANIDTVVMRQDVASLRRRCDVVIVSMHNGIEYQRTSNGQQREFAHAAIDAGALLVIGHHPHVRQETESYRNGVIFYSLGNFVFDQFQRLETQRGEIAQVNFLGHTIDSIRLLPVQITGDGPELRESFPETQKAARHARRPSTDESEQLRPETEHAPAELRRD